MFPSEHIRSRLLNHYDRNLPDFRREQGSQELEECIKYNLLHILLETRGSDFKLPITTSRYPSVHIQYGDETVRIPHGLSVPKELQGYPILNKSLAETEKSFDSESIMSGDDRHSKCGDSDAESTTSNLHDFDFFPGSRV